MLTNSPLSPEQRQHINLSELAYDVILNDSITLTGKKNISGFINTILENCGEAYFANEDLINKESYPKNITLKIRLNHNVYRDYYPDHGEWIGARHNITQSAYIKAIIEDYARKTFYERESIVYKPKLDKINRHINLPDDEAGLTPIIMKDGIKYYVKPYRISHDYEAPFHYLICQSSTEPRGEYRPVSIRISRIDDVKECVTGYGHKKLTNKDIKELEQRVKSNGVLYMLGDVMVFKIRLTPKGLNMYNSIFHQRPMYEHIDKDDNSFLLTFKSTERQIQNYFFPLAKEAEIIEPETTREWMKNRYFSAWESYDNNSL